MPVSAQCTSALALTHAHVTGPLNVPPAKKSGIEGYTDDGSLDYGLRQFTCERDYCPEPCRSSTTTETLPGLRSVRLMAEISPTTEIFGWPLLAVESAYTGVHMGSDLSNLMRDIFKAISCPIKSKQARYGAPRDAITDCIV